MPEETPQTSAESEIDVEDTEAGGDAAEAGDRAAGAAGATETTYERTANRYMARARKLLTQKDADQANYYMSSAKVVALLELADAIRSTRPN
jgi:hypothetical protein